MNRLTGASAAAGTSWSATYTYDGFTNLTNIGSSGTNPPSPMNIAVDPATNRVTGWTYDANGNVTGKSNFAGSYDVENRLQWGKGTQTGGGEEYYGYGADNRRVYQSQLTNAGTGATQEIVTFWSGGKRAGRFEMMWSGASFKFRTLETNVYFGGKPLRLGSQTNVVTDRLGSIRREAKDFFPYGQERTPTAGETEKYATYMHDGRTDLAYADQRYYAPGTGRFMTRDQGPPTLSNPTSWNRYTYALGDPIGNNDPAGRLAYNVSYDGGVGCVAAPSSVREQYDDPFCPAGMRSSTPYAVGIQTPTQRIAEVMDYLAPYMSDWDYANSSGTQFNVSFQGNGDGPGVQLVFTFPQLLQFVAISQAGLDKKYLDCLNRETDKLDDDRNTKIGLARENYSIEVTAASVGLAIALSGGVGNPASIIRSTIAFATAFGASTAKFNNAVDSANVKHAKDLKLVPDKCRKEVFGEN